MITHVFLFFLFYIGAFTQRQSSNDPVHVAKQGLNLVVSTTYSSQSVPEQQQQRDSLQTELAKDPVVPDPSEGNESHMPMSLLQIEAQNSEILNVTEASNKSYPLHHDEIDTNTSGGEYLDSELFIPDSVVTVTIPGGESEFFYHDIGPNGTLIRGGFFVASDGSDNPIAFTILDPTGAAVLRQVKSEAVFRIKTTKEGTYSFQLSNAAWRDTKYVTFGVTAGEDAFLTREHIKNFIDNLDYVARIVKDIHTESQYLWGRQRGQMMRVEKSANWIFWLSLFELVVMFSIVAFELHFLKALVANRCLF